MNKVVTTLCTLIAAGAVAAEIWHYRLQLFTFLPSTPHTELTARDGLLVDAGGKPFSGRRKEAYEGGFSIYSYEEGKLDGLNVVYSEGKLRERGRWKDDRQNGLFELYTSEGVLVDHADFVDGERDGETLQYWPDSGILKVKAFFRKGKLEGMVEQYWPGGQIQFRHRYVNNLRHGECLDYFENGALKSSVTFDKGVQTGPYRIYFEDGNLQEEGTLKNGAHDGVFTCYFPRTGKPAVQGTYRDNLYDGEVSTWRPDGMKIVQTYRNGIADGWQKIYSASGWLQGEMMVKNGRAEGPFRAYDSSGNIIQEGVHEGNSPLESRRSASSLRPSGEEEEISIREVE